MSDEVIKKPECFGLSYVNSEPCNACDLKKECSGIYLDRTRLQNLKMYVIGTCSNCRSYLAGTRMCHTDCKKVKPNDKACKRFW
jgi:hypothetical protein